MSLSRTWKCSPVLVSVTSTIPGTPAPEPRPPGLLLWLLPAAESLGDLIHSHIRNDSYALTAAIRIFTPRFSLGSPGLHIQPPTRHLHLDASKYRNFLLKPDPPYLFPKAINSPTGYHNLSIKYTRNPGTITDASLPQPPSTSPSLRVQSMLISPNKSLSNVQWRDMPTDTENRRVDTAREGGWWEELRKQH